MFVFASDTHLEEYSYIDLPEMYGDTFIAFQQIIDLAIEQNMSVVLGGDNVECNRQNYPTAVTIAFVAKQLKRLEDAGLFLYFVNGQHDRAIRNVSWLSAINPVVARPLHMTSTMIGDLEVIGINSMFSHELDAMAKIAEEYVRGNHPLVLIAHQRWKEFLKFDGAEDGSLRKLPKIFDYVITGDMHKASVWRQLGPKKNIVRTVISPGSTVRRSSSEPDKHFIYTMAADRTFKPKQLKERPVLRLAVKDVHDVDAIADAYPIYRRQIEDAARHLPAEIARPLVLISGSPTIPLYNAVQEIFSRNAFVRMSGRAGRETFTVVGMEPSRLKSAANLTCRDYIDELAENKHISQLAKLAIAAVESRNSDLIAMWRKQFK